MRAALSWSHEYRAAGRTAAPDGERPGARHAKDLAAIAEADAGNLPWLKQLVAERRKEA
jgi:hypothetical protein